MQTTRILLIALCALMPCIANADVIGCPKGTTPKGKTGPNGYEAWCDVSKNGATVKHGPYHSWWPNKRLALEGQYEYGKETGRWRGWYQTGDLQGEEWYENGKKVKARYFHRKGH